MSSPGQKREELASLLNEVRSRVAARYPDSSATARTPSGSINVPLADLMPLVHARDAAQAKIASIGTVNPRRGGVINSLIQFLKRTSARSLNWFVRDQVTFNREAVLCTEATLQALNEVNFAIVSLAGQITTAFELGEASGRSLRNQVTNLVSELPPMRAAVEQSRAENTELKDMRAHWTEWRAHWEKETREKEIYLLRTIAELQLAQQKRASEVEANFRESIKAQHGDYRNALDQVGVSIQQKLWDDLDRIKTEYERVIHSELRLIRQKTASTAPIPVNTETPLAVAPPAFDYQKFADKFRGPEEWVRRNQNLYLNYFRGCGAVLDIGCGRGEMLEDLKAANIPARGIDLSAESVAYCRSKGLAATESDLFLYLASLNDGELDGIYCSQVVEHLAPERLPEMIRLCAAKLERGGVIAIETPNPECLAIFATHFYLDPTHRRPIPPALLGFYLVEFGFGRLETYPLSPAAELIPEVAELPPGVIQRFFGGMDYAMIGRKL